MEKARRQAVGKAAMTARACGKQKAKHLGRTRAPIAAAPLHLMACDVPVEPLCHNRYLLCMCRTRRWLPMVNLYL